MHTWTGTPSRRGRNVVHSEWLSSYPILTSENFTNIILKFMNSEFILNGDKRFRGREYHKNPKLGEVSVVFGVLISTMTARLVTPA